MSLCTRSSWSVVRHQLTQHRAYQANSFFYSALLSRTWENSPLPELKQEAINRGLSPTGNKANLVLRIQQFENQKVRGVPPQRMDVSDPPSGLRHSSSSAISSLGGEAPGLPPNDATPKAAANLMRIQLPDLSTPTPEPAIKIPFVPDFWESSSNENISLERDIPKILVVAGVTTHPAGGPSHHALDVAETVEGELVAQTLTAPGGKGGKGGVLDDIVGDLGLPPIKELKSTFRHLFYP